MSTKLHGGTNDANIKSICLFNIFLVARWSEIIGMNLVKVSRTYDQDTDADLWRESGLFIKKKGRYICFSKTEGQPDYVVEDIVVINERDTPPEGYNMISYTVDTSEPLYSLVIFAIRGWQSLWIRCKFMNECYDERCRAEGVAEETGVLQN